MPEGTQLASYPSAMTGVAVVTSFAATPDLSLVAGELFRGRIGVVDSRDGKELWTAEAAKVYVTALAFSPDGKFLASAAGFSESDICLWDVATGKESGRLEGHGTWVSSIVFSPDGEEADLEQRRSDDSHLGRGKSNVPRRSARASGRGLEAGLVCRRQNAGQRRQGRHGLFLGHLRHPSEAAPPYHPG
jgi:hypothetical protein